MCIQGESVQGEVSLETAMRYLSRALTSEDRLAAIEAFLDEHRDQAGNEVYDGLRALTSRDDPKP